VLVRLSSEKLELPAGGDQQIVLDRRTTTASFPVRARTAGRFPVQVTLLTPDGTEVLQQTTYLVNSGQLPGIAIVVELAAGIVLLLWWASTLLPGRRAARRGRAAA
jgi:hypothetical protein